MVDRPGLLTPPGLLTAAEHADFVARGVQIVEGNIDGLVIDDADRLHAVRMRDDRVIECAALFVPPRFAANNDLIVRLGCEVDQQGLASVDSTGLTTIPGVWAAGNVIDPRAQVITAAGAGSAAAVALNADLVDEDMRDAVHANNSPKEAP